VTAAPTTAAFATGDGPGVTAAVTTFREIADRLYVSTHTVKSQAMAIYGKLGVSSRRGAIEQAVEAGLLDAAVIRLPGIPEGIG
jgi:LuxR family maltose regulon positive regulatory protein